MPGQVKAMRELKPTGREPSPRRVKMTTCRTCELTACRDAGTAEPWETVLRTPGWDVVQAFDSSVVGWLVLVLRRHVTSLAELTDLEAAELGPLVKQVSRALHDVTGCEKTYLAQFAESPLHRHVHVHVIPRSSTLGNDEIGPKIFGRLGVPAEEQVGIDRLTELAGKLRDRLGHIRSGD